MVIHEASPKLFTYADSDELEACTDTWSVTLQQAQHVNLITSGHSIVRAESCAISLLLKSGMVFQN